MKNARNAELDTAISIASYVIHQLHDDYLSIQNWFEYDDILPIALEKWRKPNKQTLVHEYIKMIYLDEQNYTLGKHFPVPVIREIQRLLDYPDLLKEDGIVKRIDYYPEWLKNGIFYRDKGRCSLCGCDLTGVFNIETSKNYDHIIPLKRGGNNDPSNWQLTCETCNKSKGAKHSNFKNIIFPFW